MKKASTTREANPPWYPSLMAFEHYDSGRSHVFPRARFGGSLSGNNTVSVRTAESSYPSAYNMAYLDSENIFVYGGGYGNLENSIGAFVAKVDPSSLDPVWYTQLIRTDLDGEWDYPCSMGILEDGYIYVSYGYRLAKLDPADGRVIDTLVLPTGLALPQDTSFNGFEALPDGTLVLKSVYRQAGCTVQGPPALGECPYPQAVPPSILVVVDPATMEVLSQVTLPGTVGARSTVGQFDGRSYIYLLESTSAIRYWVNDGQLEFDVSWRPDNITLTGQTICTSFVVVNDWVVAQTNTIPSAIALSVVAIHQGDASKRFAIQPFLGDPVPPLVGAVYSTAASGDPAISWAPMSVSADPEHSLIYAADALAGQIAAIRLTDRGMTTVWKVRQTTTEFTALIGTPESRVLVGTDIPGAEIPGYNKTDYAVWRDAQTGDEIARSPRLPAMTQGTMIQPYYDGRMFFEGQEGALIELTPSAD